MGTRGHVIKHGKQSGNAESLELFVFGCLRAPETEGFFVLRAIRIFLSVTTKQQDIRKKETKMNSLVIILIAMAVLVAGYVFYGRWLAKSGESMRRRRRLHLPMKMERTSCLPPNSPYFLISFPLSQEQAL